MSIKTSFFSLSAEKYKKTMTMNDDKLHALQKMALQMSVLNSQYDLLVFEEHHRTN
jgi:hypothetical protein